MLPIGGVEGGGAKCIRRSNVYLRVVTGRTAWWSGGSTAERAGGGDRGILILELAAAGGTDNFDRESKWTERMSV